jgi:hypothetical protein
MQNVIGVHISSAAAITQTLTGLVGGASSYDITVRSETEGAKLSVPFTRAAVSFCNTCHCNAGNFDCSCAPWVQAPHLAPCSEALVCAHFVLGHALTVITLRCSPSMRPEQLESNLSSRTPKMSTRSATAPCHPVGIPAQFRTMHNYTPCQPSGDQLS